MTTISTLKNTFKLSLHLKKMLRFPLFWVTLLNLCLSLTALYCAKSSVSPRFAIVDTQAVLESQKVLWLRDLNAAGQTQAAYQAFLEASNHFPEKLQKALSALHDKHHATLVTKGVFAQEAEVLDLTPDLFALMGIEPQATRQAHEALRKSLFQRERH